MSASTDPIGMKVFHLQILDAVEKFALYNGEKMKYLSGDFDGGIYGNTKPAIEGCERQ
jgi:hypothetical protein